MLLLASVICMVGAALAQVPQRCEAPLQWEGRSAANDRNYRYTRYAKTSYDGIGRRMRVVDELFFMGNRTEYIDSLYLFNEDIEYRIDMKTKKCTKQPIKWKWVPLEIPRNAKFDDEFYLGASVPEAGVLVTSWNANLTTTVSDAKEWWHGDFTVAGCFPVHTSRSRGNDYISTHYYDITVGTSDPTCFIPSSECR